MKPDIGWKSRFLPRDAMQARPSRHAVSVRLSVTFVHSVTRNKRIFKKFSPPSPDPSPTGEGDTPPRLYPPRRLDSRAFGARHSHSFSFTTRTLEALRGLFATAKLLVMHNDSLRNFRAVLSQRSQIPGLPGSIVYISRFCKTVYSQLTLVIDGQIDIHAEGNVISVADRSITIANNPCCRRKAARCFVSVSSYHPSDIFCY